MTDMNSIIKACARGEENTKAGRENNFSAFFSLRS